MKSLIKLNQQADDLRNQGQIEQSIKVYRRLIKSYEQEGNYWQAGGAIQMVGVCYRIANKTKEAIKWLEKAVDYFSQHDLVDGVGNSYRDIGITYEYVKKYKLAEDNLKKSINYLKDSKDKGSYGISLAKLGFIYIKMGKIKPAEKYLLDGLDKTQKGRHWFFEATTLGHIGELRFIQKKYQDSLKCYQNALKILDEHKQQKIHTRRYAQIWGLMSWPLLQLGKTSQAKDYFLKSLEICFDLPNNVAAVIYDDIGADRFIFELKK